MADEENTILGSEEADKTYLFFHKTIRRYRVGKFEFKDHYLRLTSPEARQEFLNILNERNFPKRDAIQIVEVNETARAQTEKPVLVNAAPVIRGNMTAGDILTQKDHQRILEAQSKPGSAGNALAPNPGAPKPAFNIAGLNLNK